MTDLSEKMTIKNLADELGVSKNTVRNQLVNSGLTLLSIKKMALSC
ncbi:DeoR family transcriptional regulator [Enterococcus faecium]